MSVKISSLIAAMILTSGLGAGIALAQDAPEADAAIANAIKARQSHMRLNEFNLGALGAIAQERVPYDAERAVAAASNLLALARFSHAGYWPEGSDAQSVQGTRAMPSLWLDAEGVSARISALIEAAEAMQTAAGTDLAALQGAMGPLSEACGACHAAYRQ
ncbi:MAG: cytochrome c [Paracoccaceae bacterium]